ncbi:MAG: hypothetical protein DI570_21185 [Phenylobacterium zucineum]|nr:MAG: hypothetical protein DI570_21185 [Phenylobacterium zucineum]
MTALDAAFDADLAADPVMALLADTAKMDMQLAREAHDRAMAAEDDDRFTEHCRNYQRMARSLRQTLALRERVLRERRLAASQKPARFDGPAVGARMRELRDAVGRVAWNEYESEAVLEKMHDVDMALAELAFDADFATRPLADQVVELCEQFEIPTRRAGAWRKLPAAAIPGVPAFVAEAAGADRSPPRPDPRRSRA